MTPIPKSHDELVRAADDTRAKLLNALGRLDQRGHEAADASKRIGAYARKFLFGRSSLALAGTCITVIAVYETVTRRRVRRLSRWRLLKDGWHPPDHARPVKRSFLLEVARSLLVSLVASTLAASVRRIVEGTGE